MAFEVRNFVIDRVRRGIMLHSETGALMWALNQIENPSLNVTAETTDAVDALGVPIATFNRAKQAEFSAESSLFDLGLLAAQNATELDVATTENSYDVPYFDEIKVTEAGKLNLVYSPVAGTLKHVYLLNGDGSTGAQYSLGDTATGNSFTLADKTVTLNAAAATVGSRWLAVYDRKAYSDEGNGAVRVTGNAVDFPHAGRFLMEVLGVDVCNPSVLYSAIIEFPNAKLLSDFELGFTTDAKHPFTLRAMQDYCDPDKRLFRIYIPETATAI